jgi:hypothetical protein
VHETLVHNIITVVLKIESIIDWSRDEQGGFSSPATTKHISEFDHAGTARARERSPKDAKGWLWAQDSWWHVAPQAKGTCVTHETIALTRDIPWAFRWLLRPIMERFPAETLTQMLQLTLTAVQSRTRIQQVPYVSRASECAFPHPPRQRN